MFQQPPLLGHHVRRDKPKKVSPEKLRGHTHQGLHGHNSEEKLVHINFYRDQGESRKARGKPVSLGRKEGALDSGTKTNNTAADCERNHTTKISKGGHWTVHSLPRQACCKRSQRRHTTLVEFHGRGRGQEKMR